jgi:uncharacterized repeat protein (TIGR03803 family)
MNTRKASRISFITFAIAAITLGLAMRAQAQTESVLYSFPGNWIGGLPESGVVLDSSGNLYGTTWWGGANPTQCDQSEGMCGTVYKLSPSAGGTWTETVLHSFSGDANGGRVFKGVVQDSAGNLYGTTAAGGNLSACGGGCGVVFELSPSSSGHWKETVLHTFSGGTDGAFPFSDLAIDAAGHLYGTTQSGGSLSGCGGVGCGVVFRLSKTSTGWHETVLRAFNFFIDGSTGTALVLDASGNVYGATSEGANFTNCGEGCGAVFKLAPAASGPWTETLLYTFNGGTDGANPIGGLTFDAAGNLYGTTEQGGGANSAGTVFKLTPTSSGPWTETQLYSFTGGADGKFPTSALVFDAAGNLYGSTPYGGNEHTCDTNGCGVVFELSPTTSGPWTETVLHTFIVGDGDGFTPSGIVRDAGGNLYGTASDGGSANLGVVFEVTP